MKSLLARAIVATAFVHFRSPEDDTPLYLLNEDAPRFGGTPHADGYARDAKGEKMPIGVVIHGAGSAEYRKAEHSANTEQIQAGKKGLNGPNLFDKQTHKLARCTEQFVNFGYALVDGGEEIVVNKDTDFNTRIAVAGAFYDDLKFAHFREEVVIEQANHANFTKKG